MGELALGNLRDRKVLRAFERLPRANIAFHAEVLDFIDRHGLAGSGIGYVDAHLLVSTRLTPDARSGPVTGDSVPLQQGSAWPPRGLE
ncbi:hypothetical protein [Enterovirga aerilata]|uniref:hypothetical protein n=1 Tax=Enterovirga aerilata TaxID=2730920 RepID=UPI0015825B71|nr:hypothetical protein [Enterovirga sp. DB1703]